jgi:hypothetical protein
MNWTLNSSFAARTCIFLTWMLQAAADDAPGRPAGLTGWCGRARPVRPGHRAHIVSKHAAP